MAQLIRSRLGSFSGPQGSRVSAAVCDGSHDCVGMFLPNSSCLLRLFSFHSWQNEPVSDGMTRDMILHDVICTQLIGELNLGLAVFCHTSHPAAKDPGDMLLCLCIFVLSIWFQMRRACRLSLGPIFP